MVQSACQSQRYSSSMLGTIISISANGCHPYHVETLVPCLVDSRSLIDTTAIVLATPFAVRGIRFNGTEHSVAKIGGDLTDMATTFASPDKIITGLRCIASKHDVVHGKGVSPHKMATCACRANVRSHSTADMIGPTHRRSTVVATNRNPCVAIPAVNDFATIVWLFRHSRVLEQAI